jgi:glycosyltransferase involved in cell wall biosynthesis
MALVIAAGIYPPEIGGVASAVADAVTDLLQANKRVQVVTYGGMQTVFEEKGALKVIRVSRQGFVIHRYFRYAYHLRHALMPGDCLWVTDISSTGIPARLAIFGKRIRLFFRLGGERSWEDAIYQKRVFCSLRDYWRLSKGGIRQHLARLQYHVVFASAEQIIVVSALLRECLLQIQPAWANKIVVVPTRVTFPAPVSRHEEKERSVLRLLYIGRITAIKNLPFLARVLARLSKQGKIFTMTIVGEGEDQSLVETTLQGVMGVTFLPSQPRDRAFALMATHDVLLLPSITDIYPHTVIEALSQGTPVVMTTEHGLEEGFGGVEMVPPQDEEAWVAALTRLLDPVHYAQLRTQIRIPERRVSSWSDRLIALC